MTDTEIYKGIEILRFGGRPGFGNVSPFTQYAIDSGLIEIEFYEQNSSNYVISITDKGRKFCEEHA